MDTEDIRKLAACFYADNGLVAARDADTLQKMFDIMTGLFDCVGLRINTTKTEVMLCVAGHIRNPFDQDAYEARMSDLHRTERKGRKMECPTCGELLAVGPLRSYLASQHGQYQCFLGPEAGKEGCGDPNHREARFYPAEGVYRCPVPNCPQGKAGAGCKTPFSLHYHFAFRHPNDPLTVRGDCLPKCASCEMQVKTAGTPAHLASKLCKGLTERRQQHTVMAAGVQALGQTFTVYDAELRRVEQFKHLGRMLAMDDNNLPAMRRNLKKARGTWYKLSRVLDKESVPGPVAGMFYQAVVASQLLYGSGTWVLSLLGLKCLEGFHVEAARRLTGMRS